VETKIKRAMNLVAHGHDDLGGKMGERLTPAIAELLLQPHSYFLD